MITDEQVENAVDYIRDKAGEYAKAKAERIYIEEFLGSKRAILIQEINGTVQERESYARSHADYLVLLESLREAVETEETFRWMMVAAQAKIDLYRTQESSKRAGL